MINTDFHDLEDEDSDGFVPDSDAGEGKLGHYGQPRIQTEVLGHSLVRSLVRSHRSLVRLLRTARFARALRCAHLFARSLTSLTSSLVGQWMIRWLFRLCFFLFSTIVNRRKGKEIGGKEGVLYLRVAKNQIAGKVGRIIGHDCMSFEDAGRGSWNNLLKEAVHGPFKRTDSIPRQR